MKVFIVSCMLISVAFAQSVPNSQPSAFLQECFDKDSISCVQTTVRLKLFHHFFFFFSSDFFFYFNSFYLKTKCVL